MGSLLHLRVLSQCLLNHSLLQHHIRLPFRRLKRLRLLRQRHRCLIRNDEAGKKKKTAHMDWHFKVNQRMVEAEKRGQHRSWFVDELDWIKSREVDEKHLASSTDAGAGAGKEVVAAKVPRLQWLPVPDDAALVQSVCPICQEKFEMKWLDDAQEFVWMDAVQIGNRVYHASCHSEAKKNGSTPEPVLGKRKNEEHDVSVRTKIKTEA